MSWEEDDHNRVYYRILKSYREPNKLVAACMQWFDELDYDQDRFINEEKYESEEAAQAVIDQIMGLLFRTNALQLIELVSPKGLWAHYLQASGHGRTVCPHCGKGGD